MDVLHDHGATGYPTLLRQEMTAQAGNSQQMSRSVFYSWYDGGLREILTLDKNMYRLN
jgi:hypothetical protein